MNKRIFPPCDPRASTAFSRFTNADIFNEHINYNVSITYWEESLQSDFYNGANFFAQLHNCPMAHLCHDLTFNARENAIFELLPRRFSRGNSCICRHGMAKDFFCFRVGANHVKAV